MLQTLFGIAVVCGGVWWWFSLPFAATAVLRLSAEVDAERVAPQVVAKLTAERFVESLRSECESPGRRVRVRRRGKAEIEVEFRCERADGALRGVTAVLQRAQELDVVERDRVVDRPVAPVELNPQGTGSLARGGPMEWSLRLIDPPAPESPGYGGRQLAMEVVQRPSEPEHRLF